MMMKTPVTHVFCWLVTLLLFIIGEVFTSGVFGNSLADVKKDLKFEQELRQLCDQQRTQLQDRNVKCDQDAELLEKCSRDRRGLERDKRNLETNYQTEMTRHETCKTDLSNNRKEKLKVDAAIIDYKIEKTRNADRIYELENEVRELQTNLHRERGTHRFQLNEKDEEIYNLKQKLEQNNLPKTPTFESKFENRNKAKPVNIVECKNMTDIVKGVDDLRTVVVSGMQDDQRRNNDVDELKMNILPSITKIHESQTRIETLLKTIKSNRMNCTVHPNPQTVKRVTSENDYLNREFLMGVIIAVLVGVIIVLVIKGRKKIDNTGRDNVAKERMVVRDRPIGDGDSAALTEDEDAEDGSVPDSTEQRRSDRNSNVDDEQTAEEPGRPDVRQRNLPKNNPSV
ncbi:uncharacterized protein LOC141904210 [Tubulanus polymorphus]|uniref:uncharacterized protein LOC141904210 n=1 Tax=Tubulanus polymorphus TaxID=672921 RepID=UPI003DA5C89C